MRLFLGIKTNTIWIRPGNSVVSEAVSAVVSVSVVVSAVVLVVLAASAASIVSVATVALDVAGVAGVGNCSFVKTAFLLPKSRRGPCISRGRDLFSLKSDIRDKLRYIGL